MVDFGVGSVGGGCRAGGRGKTILSVNKDPKRKLKKKQQQQKWLSWPFWVNNSFCK